MRNYIKYLGILALGMVACEPEFENPVDEQDAYTSGEADFSNYVALGNSLTAGYADNALYITGQENSYPNILAMQFAKVQATNEFRIPYMADNAGGLLLGGQQITANRRVLSFDARGNPMPAVYAGTATTEITNTLEGPFNNLGAPGAKVYHLGFEGYGNVEGVATGMANPYFARFASSPNASIIADAVAQNPTFFSLWIGNNDVLGYATSGGVGIYQEDPTVSPTMYGSNDITNPIVFASAYSGLVTALTEGGAEGVLINIPDVTDVPFFTTVPYAPLDPTNPDFGPQIPTLNATFGSLNQAFAVLGVPERSIVFSETAASAVVVKDESLQNLSEDITRVLMGGGLDQATATIYGMQFGQARQATAEDLIPLTSSGAIGVLNEDRMQALMAMGVPQETAGMLSVNGVSYPLEDQHVLTMDEQAKVAVATSAYNQTIQDLAQANNLVFVDAAAMLSDVAGGGIAFDAGMVTSTYVTGGAFSLDGVHLTPRGYALVANKIIEEVNETYNATVPKVNIGNYPTVTPSNNVN
ncbi:G-D-S-L family lipolytic protein [Salinimicrobium sp. GXAS 041]|uniref:G-D-S-L family lipolytic protein n=1 Tax=Salinimicrobium sp. GXAS 041 TaxID=3400806 RepID=UPI003C7813F2